MHLLGRRAFLMGLGGALAACASRPGDDESDDSALATSARKKTDPIVVLGAGISGLAAARRLTERGFTNVTVLEARDRLGGRLSTDRSLGMPFDLGGAWAHHAGSANPIVDLLAQANVETTKTSWDKIALYDAARGAIADAALNSAEADFEKILNRVATKIRAAHGAGPYASFLSPELDARYATKDDRRLAAWLRAFYIENEYAADVGDIDATEFANYDQVSHAENDRFVAGGYDRVIALLARGLDVRTGEACRKVTTTASGVTVITDKARYDAAAVIVTLPVGVLRSGSVTFEPGLPDDKRRAIETLGVGDFEKVVLLFDEAFWPRDPHAFGFASGDANDAPLLVNGVAAAGAPAIVAMFSGRAARALSNQSDTAARDRVLAQLKTMFGTVRAPVGVLRTRWHDDPFARGAYTYPATATTDTDVAALARPIDKRLYWAGEATDTKAYSYVHGAYASGLRAANEI
ncbi:MAG: FAD-dependent oxidoreductase [Polyangiaceae bacterium]